MDIQDMTNEALATRKVETTSEGERNSIPYLLLLEEPAQRLRAWRNGWLYMNLYGGNFSGSVYSAVRDIQTYGLGETPAERMCREDQERENRRREDRFAEAAREAQARRLVGFTS